MNNIITNYAGQLLMNAESEKNLIAVADKVASCVKTQKNVKIDDLYNAFRSIFRSQHDGDIFINYYYFGEGNGCYDMKETTNSNIAQYVQISFEEIDNVTNLVKTIIEHLKSFSIFSEIELYSNENCASFFAKII